ncbi:MAG: hypothetical protein KAU12_00240 [Candidatus Omnitrophica bacterium]|nr:hypothetical protein [Candidatus Omnitrophota bacterium]
MRQIEGAAMKKLKLYLAAQEGIDLDKHEKSQKKKKVKVNLRVSKKNLKGLLQKKSAKQANRKKQSSLMKKNIRQKRKA